MKPAIKQAAVLFVLITAGAALSFLCGCGGGGGGNSSSGFTLHPTSGQSSGAATLAVRVLDATGNPVPGVSVSVNGGAQTLTTDANGSFSVPVASVAADGTPVRMALTRNCYVPELETVRVFSNSLSNGTMQHTITLRREPATLEEATQAQITRSDGSTQAAAPVLTTDADTGLTMAQTTVTVGPDDRAVAFTTPASGGAPPDVTFTIGDPSGAGPNAAAVLGAAGAFTGSITYGNPMSQQDLALFPGEFLTSSAMEDGSTAQGALITAGFARISLKDANGNPVTSFNGAQAQITMRVPGGMQNPETGATIQAGDSIPVFVFNEDTGEWVVEKTPDGAIKRTMVENDANGMFVTFTTSHLSWFNLDFWGDRCESGTPKVHFVDAQGQPVTGYYLAAYRNGWIDAHSHIIYDSVVAFMNVPRNSEWAIQATLSDVESRIITISSCALKGTGETEFTVVLDQPRTHTESCIFDSDCDDQNVSTMDSCEYSYSEHTNTCQHIIPACNANTDCDDQNSLTTDRCYNPGSRYASCQSYVPACTQDSDCNDSNSLTTDVCNSPGEYYAYCYHFTPVCSSDAQCNDNKSETTDMCFYPNTRYAYCAHNIPKCRNDAMCNDNYEATVDTCLYPGMSYAWCYNWRAACSSDTQCNDNKNTTNDTCMNPGTYNAYCMYTACTPACYAASGCDDQNATTTDTCLNAGACNASCSNIACEMACTADAQCDDSLPTTIDRCVGAGTCSAECVNTQDASTPQVFSFFPNDGNQNVPYDQAMFTVIFTKSMDASINMNDPATLAASGFSVTLQHTGTGTFLTIDPSNALAYGAFSWTDMFMANDTLKFSLKTNAALQAAGLKHLQPGVTYNITARTVPGNLKDATGAALDAATNILSTGSFKTMN